MMPSLRQRVLRRIGVFAALLLAIEFLDEFVFGVREAAWPLIRDELKLDYAQIGLLLGVPTLVSTVVEPFFGILGDVWKRKAIILGGGVAFAVALLAIALSQNFILLLVGFMVLYPASGAFVSLSQASLMDAEPARHEQNMARWTFAGSLGVVVGTLAVSLVAATDVGWRPLFFVGVLLAAFLTLVGWRFRFPGGQQEDDEEEQLGFRKAMVNALLALRRGEVVRWLILLQFSDLMLDILLGFLALYFVDVAGATEEQAALGVTAWTVIGLIGDFLLIPLLERVRGLIYLRISALIELLLFPAFLFAPELWQKYVLLALLGFFNAGWYSILQARLYSSMPGQSGAVLTLTNIFGIIGGAFPLILGFVADNYNLQLAMWLMLAGPIALLIGLPRQGPEPDPPLIEE